jgi:hypothetical protein
VSCCPVHSLGVGCGEDGVHDFGAGGEDGTQFAAVDDFGGAGAGVPGEASEWLRPAYEGVT